jgi:hypothetical protein
VDRQDLAQVESGWQHLQAAVAPLARCGDPLGSQLYRASLMTGLETLTDWFLARQAEPESR